MAKIIQSIVDAEGNVEVDFSGFSGTECLLEEDRFLRELAMLGLQIKGTLPSTIGAGAASYIRLTPKRSANDLRTNS